MFTSERDDDFYVLPIQRKDVSTCKVAISHDGAGILKKKAGETLEEAPKKRNHEWTDRIEGKRKKTIGKRDNEGKERKKRGSMLSPRCTEDAIGRNARSYRCIGRNSRNLKKLFLDHYKVALASPIYE